MNPQLNALRIALLQCLSTEEVTAEQVTEVIRETVKQKMEEGNMTVAKTRTVLDKLRIPHHYTTCPDYLKKDESVTINFDGISGANYIDSTTLIDSLTSDTIPPFV